VAGHVTTEPGFRMSLRVRLMGVAGMALLVSGCASTYQPWMNRPLESPVAAQRGFLAEAFAKSTPTNSGSLMFIVNFSGGGTRAAALAYGVLEKLRATTIRWEDRDTSLLHEIDILSAVSGGSITAAYYAAFGDRLFLDFRSRFLDRDFESDLISRALQPSSAYRLTSPRFGRGNFLAEQLDGLLFHGVTYGDLESARPRPMLLITATDLSLGASFQFDRNDFNLICSNLGTVPIAIAVAASNSVPIVFSPIMLKNNAETCRVRIPPAPRSAAAALPGRSELRHLEEQDTYRNGGLRPYIQLVDGGLSDNLGVSRLIDEITTSGSVERALGSTGPHRIRKLVFLNVNAEHRRTFEIDRADRVPSVFEVARALQFGLLTRYTEETSDRFAQEAQKWRDDMRRNAAAGGGPYSADADLYYIEVGLENHPDGKIRDQLRSIPTSYSLGRKQVEELIDAGREILDSNTEFKRLISDLDRIAHPGVDHPER
jgi:NTE family protein